jgi:hypothetical protein
LVVGINNILTSARLKGHLRDLILSKRARPGIDINALIEKRHKDANLKIFNKSQSDRIEERKTKPTRKPTRTTTGGGKAGGSLPVRSTDESSDLSEIGSISDFDYEDSVISMARSRARTKDASDSFKVALRLYRKATAEELSCIGPCHSYGTMFLTSDLKSPDECFAHICQNIDMKCTYIEFHPPEDMSLEGRIRINQGSEEAEYTFQRIMSMLREARKFPGEPSYRTVEVEVGIDTTSDE